jgi:hypothetical protein
LVLKDHFDGGCDYAILSGGYNAPAHLVLKSFNVDTTNLKNESIKAITVISTEDSRFAGQVTAPKFIKSGGTST